MSKLFTLLLGLTLSLPMLAIDESELLRPEDAFRFTAKKIDDSTLSVVWDIADHYYMYRGRMSFSSLTDGVTLGEPQMPDGKKKTDEFFGEVETYKGRIEVKIPFSVQNNQLAEFEIKTKSQGCAEMGICYPPQTQNASFPLAATSNSAASAAFPLIQSGVSDSDVLPPDEAFNFEAASFDGNEIVTRFTLAPNYYLYRDKISFKLLDHPDVLLGNYILAAGSPKVDLHFGDVEVFYDQLEIVLPLIRQSINETQITLEANYQGCLDNGICYPPESKLIDITLPAISEAQLTKNQAANAAKTDQAVAAGPPVRLENQLANSLRKGDWLVLNLLFVLGLGLAFTPCVFPMIPILSSIIAGQDESLTRAKSFMLSLTYVLAMALTYTLVGVIAGVSGSNLQLLFQTPWIIALFSGVFVALAFSMFGFYQLQLPTRWQSKLTEYSNRQEGGKYVGTAIMGVLSALIVGPCVAAPIAGVLIYISESGSPLFGGLALFCLSMGMGTPLLAIGFMPRAGAWMDAVKVFFGVSLLGMAIWFLERIISPTLVLALWGMLFISYSIYLGALESLGNNANGWTKLRKGLGVVLLLLGILEIIGAASGSDNMLQPLEKLGLSSGSTAVTQKPQFEKVANLAELQQRIKAASTAGKPLMLDFYADWCVDCKRMDRYTFSDPRVSQILSNAVIIKADVTKNNDADAELMKHYGIIGPPATLFFDRQGNENRAYRLLGYVDAKEFAGIAANAMGIKE